MTIEKLGFIVWTPNPNALDTYNGLEEELADRSEEMKVVSRLSELVQPGQQEPEPTKNNK